MIDILNISNEISLGRIPRDLADDKSTLVNVPDWCRQIHKPLSEAIWNNLYVAIWRLIHLYG